jgi:hypothetical protein
VEHLLTETVQSGDIVLFAENSQMARSTLQVLVIKSKGKTTVMEETRLTHVKKILLHEVKRLREFLATGSTKGGEQLNLPFRRVMQKTPNNRVATHRTGDARLRTLQCRFIWRVRS